MKFLIKIKKKLIGSNNPAPPKELDDSADAVLKEIDNTMIDADERIEKMFKEVRASLGV